MADFPVLSAFDQTGSEGSHTFTDRGYFRAFSRGRSEGCSTALSLRKMSGISTEIYCCLPKPYLLLTCHNVASAFFRLLESVKPTPQGNGSAGLCEVGRYGSSMGRSAGPKPAALLRQSPCRNPGEPRLARPEQHAVRTVWHRPRASSAYSGKVFSRSERQWDFWLSQDWKIGSQGSSLLNRQKHTTFIYTLKSPVCGFNETPSFGRTKRGSC